MDKDKMSDDGSNQLMFIKALSREVAIGILLRLCKDCNLLERITAMAEVSFSVVDAETIAVEVFTSLNSIQVEDLWDNSGKTYTGYHEPTEVAFDMIEDEVRIYVREMEKYETLGMKTEEKVYCKGIIAGLLRYAEEGDNEFRDWCPDDPYTIAENVIFNWKKNHTAEEIEEIQVVYDSFFSDNGMD